MAVLVVEDDDSLRETMLEVLRVEGYRAIGVADLAAARACLRVVQPTLVILDAQLAGESARPLLHELAMIEADARPLVLLVSGSREASSIAEEFNVPYIKKPFDLEVFLADVERLDARRSLI